MKKSLLVLTVVALALVLSMNASAQSKLSLNIGGNVFLPVGTFGDVTSIGFGGDVLGEYSLQPQLSLYAKVGYYLWVGKSITQGTVSFDAPNFSCIPIMVGGKYYFMPEGKLRVYGAGEIGLMIASVTVKTPEVKVGNTVILAAPETSSTETDLAFAPIVGFEMPMGKGALDVSARFLIISTTGSSSSSLGVRAGYKFPL